MAERLTGQSLERYKGRKPIQVLLNPKELNMVEAVADAFAISAPDAIRRAIHLQDWVRMLQGEGPKNLVLGLRNEKGEIEIAIPVPWIGY